MSQKKRNIGFSTSSFSRFKHVQFNKVLLKIICLPLLLMIYQVIYIHDKQEELVVLLLILWLVMIGGGVDIVTEPEISLRVY